MTTQTIDATQIKALRKARKIGRPKLAKLTGLTERQIAKLEGINGTTTVPAITVERLSDALQITPLVLTGDLPMIEDDLKPVEKSSCTSGCCG